MFKQINKKSLIGIGALAVVSILPISVVACASNSSKIESALNSIVATNFTISNKNKLASEINLTNLTTELTITRAVIDGVSITYSIKQKSVNDTTGTITLIVTGTIRSLTRTKNLEISGFQTTEQRNANIAIAQEAINPITVLERTQLNQIATTLASSVDISNLDLFVQTPFPLGNGVRFTLSPIFSTSMEQIKTDDTTGTLALRLTASFNGGSVSKVLTVDGFKKI
ncbi:lipoprotein 17-related variable surface protein [[Mycoplasma] mobile]|uniref:Variable surface protein mvspJ n=1 Tax=Mycoplasma mobile (strain ATCC 43663 / 163K / NCTC 11711) TaxID=267748 RepID=Q6KHV5_MYCM1|nr:lipoprotein 17-related variable surface protein [[Mycoplasma] mobile]AAT27822.1 variable surface protein mvspJ [Mycoplasma mobile 163K]